MSKRIKDRIFEIEKIITTLSQQYSNERLETEIEFKIGDIYECFEDKVGGGKNIEMSRTDFLAALDSYKICCLELIKGQTHKQGINLFDLYKYERDKLLNSIR